MAEEDDPEQSPRERAKQLQAEIAMLRIREGTANFEDKEAFRRAIREREAELEALGVDPDDESA
ncbi:hypothetical protein [Haloglomus salinum]|jgi:hypothetical protein|uniref:hypothetical protein n=1 Tax=Haloglomus salinum TaxID=2962673 RepID=UPI0020C9DFA6|nr:hypothetical protein [Haloglomus salinum]